MESTKANWPDLQDMEESDEPFWRLGKNAPPHSDLSLRLVQETNSIGALPTALLSTI